MPSIAHVFILCLLPSLEPAAAQGGTVYRLTPQDDWLTVVNGEGLAPGSVVVLSGGRYVTPDNVMLDIAHVGTALEPITIRAAAGETPVITRNTHGAHDDFYANLEHNVINMRGAQHVILEGLEITGGNWGIRIGSKTNGQNAVPRRPMGDIVRPAHDITVQNCHIHHTHNTAVSANFPGDVYDGLVFRDNHIHHAGRYGESFYLGNYSSTGETWGIVKNSTIENNYLHDNVWIRSWYQDPNGPRYHGTAIQLKDGCYNNVVRGNIIHYTRYPGILISGAESPYGTRSAPDWGPNLVEGNAIWQVSQAANDLTGQGMQVAADAVIRNNIVYAPQPFYNSNHQALAGNLEIVNNTFITSTAAQGETLRIANAPSASILIANNALYRGSGRTDVVTGSVGSPWIIQTGNVAILDLPAALGDPSSLNFYPAAGSPLLNAADLAHQSGADFNGTPRPGDPTVGAYAYDAGGNPGVSLGENREQSWSCQRNGSGANPRGFHEWTKPILGRIWRTSVDVPGRGTLGSMLVLGLGGPTQGLLLGGLLRGELLCRPPYLLNRGTGMHALPIDSDPSLVGLTLIAQGVTLDPSGLQLQNAIEISIGTF